MKKKTFKRLGSYRLLSLDQSQQPVPPWHPGWTLQDIWTWEQFRKSYFSHYGQPSCLAMLTNNWVWEDMWAAFFSPSNMMITAVVMGGEDFSYQQDSHRHIVVHLFAVSLYQGFSLADGWQATKRLCCVLGDDWLCISLRLLTRIVCVQHLALSFSHRRLIAAQCCAECCAALFLCVIFARKI